MQYVETLQLRVFFILMLVSSFKFFLNFYIHALIRYTGGKKEKKKIIGGSGTHG